MSLFSFFKKSPSTKVSDKVYISDTAKYKALLNLAKQNSTVFVAWFDDSVKKLQAHFEQNGITATIVMYRQLNAGNVNNKNIVFIEHYPLKGKEETLFTTLNQKEIVVYVSLEEPLMKLFGSERIIELMKKMGLTEEEELNHSMITASIQKAQEKLAKKVTLEQSASSQQEWFRRNVPDSL